MNAAAWRRAGRIAGLVAIGLACTASVASAASISEIMESDWREQLGRFFSMQDPSLRYALVGSILLGLSCGLLGSFIVVRRMALVGDALSHAVLPGVAFGFLWGMTKDPWAIFIGAVVAGLAGTTVVSALVKTTRIKPDTALGLVLASFFAVGLCMLSMIQNLPTGNKSGLDKFLFGQAAALGADDITLMAIVTTLAVSLITLFYKELLATSFDVGFAQVAGIPAGWIHHGLMLVLAAATVIALQAVGVVLVSAMLITPAAAAYLLTDRLHRMLFLAGTFGVLAGVTGAFFSFVGRGLPTGPLMVIGASIVFTGAYLMGPRHGVVARWWRQRSRSARTERENTLKALYHVWEADGFRDVGVTLADLAERRKETLDEALRRSRELENNGLASVNRDAVYFTPQGRRRAAEIVRNHRLWELYLTNSANIAPDHVHEDAEKIEHVLGEKTVRELERRLDYATIDPHGRPIPGPRDIHGGQSTRSEATEGQA
jgi:ABC-type Mn2+/Zn2+ transport system permease subunit/Mn-dependent DtxR family transcriptional regulator